MRRITWVVAFAALAGTAIAADGQVQPVACPIEQVPDLRGLYAGEQDFYKPPEPKGTVNPHAVVAVLRNGATALAVAVDSEKPDAKGPDLVRLDFSGKGEFAGAPVVPLKPQGKNESQSWATFGPATVTITRNGKLIPATVQGSYNKSSEYRFINVQLGCALEGRLAFGPKTYAVRVIDSDGDLAFGTKATATGISGRVRYVSPCDSIAIDTADGSFRQKVIQAYYGQPVRVDGCWYDVELSPDGTQVSAKPLAGEMAQLRIAQAQWSATLVGDKHILKVEGSTEPIPIPADRYTVLVFEQSAPYNPQGTAAGSMARLTCRPGRRADSPVAVIDAAAGKMVDLGIGSPLTASIATDVGPAPVAVPGVIRTAQAGDPSAKSQPASQNGPQVRMDFNVADAPGLMAQVFLPNAGMVTPGVEVMDAAGKRVYEGQFQYG